MASVVPLNYQALLLKKALKFQVWDCTYAAKCLQKNLCMLQNIKLERLLNKISVSKSN